jgi:hypothetical protein
VQTRVSSLRLNGVRRFLPLTPRGVSAFTSVCDYLATAEVISQVERYHVKAVLLWTGRLNHLPGLAVWLEQTFPTREYVRP